MDTLKTNLVARREDIAAIVHEVYASWLQDAGANKVTCAYDINSGPCEEFAGDVVNTVLERFPGTEIDIEDYEDYLNGDGLTAQGIHYYVKAGSWYFDASERDGVTTPDILPTCNSIRRYAKSLGEDIDDLSEMASDDEDDLPSFRP